MKELINLCRAYTGVMPDKVEFIPQSVSLRQYFRIYKRNATVIGTYSPDEKETIAFKTYSDHFRVHELNVPEVYAVSEDQKFYLQTDLGDSRLFDLLVSRPGKEIDDKIIAIYREAIAQLTRMQVVGDQGLDYSVAVPRSAFDYQSVKWDLQYFKYYFLKPSGIPFDEQKLEEAFDNLAGYIAGIEIQGFMFRDFQSRNIMVRNDEPWLIDFQGGRRGPLQYDLTSLVYESRVELCDADRERLISCYLENLSDYTTFNKAAFMTGFYPVALARILQALGAYGLRGNIEKRGTFLQSIPAGLRNLGEVLKKTGAGLITDYLRVILQELILTAERYPMLPEHFNGLTVTIHSFSYRRPLPDDITGNGGGFVYDCRFLANPGLCDEFKSLNGFDREVIRYLDDDPGVPAFFESIKMQLSASIQRYKELGYTNLMVSFGCTGGRHRSVYMAHAVASWCRTMNGVRVFEHHRELGKKI